VSAANETAPPITSAVDPDLDAVQQFIENMIAKSAFR